MISIVYPIYNVADYLEESLKSVLSQDYADIEVVAVNDGSTDNSFEILEKYAATDNRIKVINQQNLGVAKARLNALSCVSGNYVCFVDSDDILPVNSLTLLYETIKENDSDISAGNYSKIFSDGNELEYKYLESKTIGTNECIDLLLSYKMSIALWGKLFKTELFRNAKLVPFKISQDLCLLFQAIARTSKVALTSDVVYKYVQRPSSTIHTQFNVEHCANYYLSRRWIADFVRSECKDFFDYDKLDGFVLQGFAYTLCLGGKRFLKEKDIQNCKRIFTNCKKCLPIGQRIVVQTVDIPIVNIFLIKIYQIRIKNSKR